MTHAHRGSHGLIGVFSGAPDPYVTPGESTAAPLFTHTFARLLAKADPQGVENHAYDNMAIIEPEDKSGETFVSPKRVQRGKPVRYTFMTELEGELARANVPVTIRLSKGQQFTSAKYATCRRAGGPRKIRCTIPMLWTGDQSPVILRVKTTKNAPARVSATATAHSTFLDQDKSDNTQTLTASTRK